MVFKIRPIIATVSRETLVGTNFGKLTTKTLLVTYILANLKVYNVIKYQARCFGQRNFDEFLVIRPIHQCFYPQSFSV